MKTLIIPAAGQATRLKPVSSSVSKAMVLVNGKPIIRYILDQYASFYDNIVIVYGQNLDLKTYCEKHYPNVKLVKQENPQGPLHAIHCGLNVLEDVYGSLTVWLGDTIVTDYFITDEQDVPFVMTSKVEDWQRWCMITFDGVFYDKPDEQPPTNLALVGVYYNPNINKSIEEINSLIESGIKHKGEFQISQWLQLYKQEVRLTDNWYDCGDIASLYKSSGELLVLNSRPDNTIEYNEETNLITKSGARVKNECHWYFNKPKRIDPFVPAIYDISFVDNSYTMEHVTGITLDSLFVYEQLTADTYSFIINKLIKIYYDCFFEIDVSRTIDLSNMFITKNIIRVIDYSRYGISNDEIMMYCKYVSSFENVLKTHKAPNKYIHGDFHFGNIIFDSSTGKIKFIDPRGEWDSQICQSGHFIYDLTKLQQSVFGEYMWIYHDIEVNQKIKEKLQQSLDSAIQLYYSEYVVELCKKLVPITMGSCLSFHTESPDRQQRIWNKTMQLISEVKCVK